jgi:predicted ATPase
VAPVEPKDIAQVADAVASTLAAIAEEVPVALLIDDAHWADGVTLAALRAVWSRERHAAMVLILTMESGITPSPEARALLGTIGREVSGLQVKLEPLSPDVIMALTQAMAPWCSGTDERSRLSRRVEHESGGNVFLASTLLRDLAPHEARDKTAAEWPPAGATYDAELPITLPGAVRSAILERVSRLDADSVSVLRGASIGSPRASARPGRDRNRATRARALYRAGW